MHFSQTGRYRPFTRPARPPEPAGFFPLLIAVAGTLLIGVLVAAESATGTSSSPTTWYATRAAGLTLYLLIWLAVMLGLAITTKRFDRFIGRGVIFSLHTYAMQLSYGFLLLHLLTLVADMHDPFGPQDLFVPFASGVSEPWTGLGVVAFWLLAIIAISTPARRWISFWLWRWLHMLSFPLYGLALVHGVGAGSDSKHPWVAAIYLTTVVAVIALLVYRMIRWNQRSETAPVRKEPAPPFERMAASTSNAEQC